MKPKIPWFLQPDVIALATFLVVIPVAIGLRWLITPIVSWAAHRFGAWPIIIFFGVTIVVIAADFYRRWKLGLLAYQRQRTIELHNELKFPPPVWPPDVQAIIDAEAWQKAEERAIKDKWRQPGPRIPPME